ncbi:hypothetical protein LBMAG45_07220 [Nitrospirota bacterium]|nr:hypothetical protein LBMAG45_07220 [Nitrospirota bacterium]
MNFLCATFSVLLSLISVSWAAESEVIPPGDLADSASLQEATRVLEEEIKLAAKPQTYVFIDLVTNAILIKGRGVELHRIPIERWSGSDLSRLAAPRRLRERPQVNRRKIDHTAVTEQDPISLVDMPTTFTLKFAPLLTILVLSNTDGNPWQWTLQQGRVWWSRLTAWGQILRTGVMSPPPPSLNLTVSLDHAQSLAWTVTEGMPFLIRRPTP